MTEINLERRSSCSSGERVKVFTQPFYHCQSPQEPFPVFCTAASQPRSLPFALSLALSQSQSYFVSLPSFYHSKALSVSGPLHCSFVSPLFVLPLHTCPQPRLLLFFSPFFSLTGTLPFHISLLSLTLSFFCSVF